MFARKRDDVHLLVRYFHTVLADAYYGYYTGGGLGRAHAASRRGLLFSFFDPTS